jgi:hypothetical protein
MAQFNVNDHVRLKDDVKGEDVGIVHKVGSNGRLWVETGTNMYRGWSPDEFVHTSAPLSLAVEWVDAAGRSTYQRGTQPTTYDTAETMLAEMTGSRPILPEVCPLDDCGCSGLAHP